jgi:predicted metal-binding membrane protein
MTDYAYRNLPTTSAMLARLAARPRPVAVGCIVAITVLGWAGFGATSALDGGILTTLCGPAPISGTVTASDAMLVFAMWVAMALAMMVPAAAPMILTYADIAEAAARKGEPIVSPPVLVFGYIVVWIAFAAAVTAIQILMSAETPHLGDYASSASSLLFVAAGAYQFVPLKQACLHKCRSPFQFFFTNWQTTPRGVFRLGLRQGVFCLGCCWAAMTVMIAAGVMNVLWMIGLAIAMTVEKMVPSRWPSYGLGIVLLVIGIALAASQAGLLA